MTLREQIEQRRRQWEAFNRWEEQQPPLEREPQRRRQWEGVNRWEEQQPPLEREPGQILADLGAILRWIPEEDRLHDPDPETRGVQVLLAAGRVLNRRHEIGRASCRERV